jgi:hypothetical protein
MCLKYDLTNVSLPSGNAASSELPKVGPPKSKHLIPPTTLSLALKEIDLVRLISSALPSFIYSQDNNDDHA